MIPGRLIRVFFVFVLLFTASFAGAATTEFRFFLDTDRNSGTGCNVRGMDGVEQVLVTQVTDFGSIARVTRTFRQLCAGNALGAIIDDDTSNWDAVLQSGSGELTFETRMRLSSFGPEGIAGDMRLGFEGNRPPATHVALADDDGSDVVLSESAAPRRRASRSAGAARAIVLDGNLADWIGVDSAIYGIASGGTRVLRLLRVYAWADPAEPVAERFLYFAVVARLASDAPFADDDVYSRQDGQSLSVAGPGVLANDGDPLGEDLDAEIVTEPARGSVVLNGEEGGFTYSPSHPQSKATDSFEYRVRAGTRQSNVARVRIKVRDGAGNEPPSFTAGGDVTVAETSGLYQEPWATAISPGPGETQTVVFTVSNDNHALFSMQPAIAPNGTLRFVPFLNRHGSAVVTVTLTDSEGTSTTPSTFTIFVTDVNGAPDFKPGPNQSLLEDAGPRTVSAWATQIVPGPPDESGQSAAFTVIGNTNPSLFSAGPSVSPTGVLTYTAAPNANGVATITLVLIDDGSPAATSEEKQFVIAVTAVNDQPSFTAGALPIVVVDTAGAQTVAGWATSVLAGPANESRQALDFIVSNDNPALFSMTPAVAPNGTLTFTPAPGRDGVATVTVRIHDNGGVANGGVDTSAPHTFQITVERAPTITSASGTTFTAGQPGTFAVTATGLPTPSIAQGGTLPAGITFTSGTLSGTPAALTGGAYPLTFQATNSRGSSPVQNFTLTVNEAPAITSANSAAFTQGVFASFSVTTTGYPDPSIALSGQALPAGLTLTDHGDGTATLSGEPAAAAGSYGFTLTASNGVGTNATQSFTINIGAGSGSTVYPMPGSTTAPPVICSACPGVNSFNEPNDGLQTYPYGAPIVDHVGRYVDSQQTPNFQHAGFRTARARTMRTHPQANGQAPPRVYIQIGNAVGAYALDTFFSTKLPAGLVSVRAVQTGSRVDRFGMEPEKIVMWDGFFYPEAIASGWFAPLIDQQDPMGKGGPFDVDDRGYIYAGFPSFGWGVARDDGRTDTTHFAKVVQMVAGGDTVDQGRYPNTRDDSSGVSPDSILVVPHAGKYYAVIAALTTSRAVFDVTTPGAPLHLATYPGAGNAMRRWDRSDAVQRVAYVDGRLALHVYSYEALVGGGAPILTVAATSGGFADVAIDETGTIWAIESTRLVKLTPAGGGYVTTSYAAPFGAGFGRMSALAVGAGHLAINGVDSSTGRAVFDVRLASIEAGAPSELPLNGFFRNYYHGALAGYAQPGPYVLPADLQIVLWNGRTYLMYSANGLGDVFEIDSP